MSLTPIDPPTVAGADDFADDLVRLNDAVRAAHQRMAASVAALEQQQKFYDTTLGKPYDEKAVNYTFPPCENLANTLSDADVAELLISLAKPDNGDRRFTVIDEATSMKKYEANMNKVFGKYGSIPWPYCEESPRNKQLDAYRQLQLMSAEIEATEWRQFLHAMKTYKPTRVPRIKRLVLEIAGAFAAFYTEKIS